MTQAASSRSIGAETLARFAPLQRIGDDEDLKGAALLFASDAGKHITGQILAVDGGVMQSNFAPRSAHDARPQETAMPKNRRFILASRPTGAARPAISGSRKFETPTLPPGQMLVRNEWLSLDPYMRGRMNEGRSYAKPQVLGEVMQGGTAGTVVESRNPQFEVGDRVVGYLGWQEYGVSRRQRHLQGRHARGSAVSLSRTSRHARSDRVVRAESHHRAEGR